MAQRPVGQHDRPAMTTRRALRVLLKAGHQVERSSISTAYVVDGRLCSQQRLRELAAAQTRGTNDGR